LRPIVRHVRDGQEVPMNRAFRHAICGALAGLAACASLAAGASAQPADPVAAFYAGKSIRIVIGYSPGGGYDLYARMLARHMGKHLPGNPNIVAENMPGAGSLRAANFLYGAAPKDGTMFGTFGRGIVMEPLLQRSGGAKFEATKFTWIGSISDEVSVCAFWHATGIRTWQDLKSSPKPVTVGATGSGSDTDVYAIMIRNLLRAPLKLVSGYPGGADINLAVQRGEVDGRCGWSWSSLLAREKPLYDDKRIHVVAQISLKKHDDLPDVPRVVDLTDSPSDLAAIRLIVSRESMARPFAAPPGIPPERVAALRRAFDLTMKDPEFIAEARRQSVEVRPLSGAEVDALVKEVYASSPEVVKLAIEATKITP
jgi:tripartite-type tricarboxylate transporter receptor subunit TctC